MEKFEIFSSENCYICNESVGSFKTDLTVVTGYSERPIFQLIESFSSIELSNEIINESGVCQSCFNKFNEYDEHLTLADQLQAELIGLMDNKLYFEESEIEENIKNEGTDELGVVTQIDNVEYEPYEDTQIYDEEVMEEGEEDDMEVKSFSDSLQQEYDYEEVVEETKIDKSKPRSSESKPKASKKRDDFIIVELDDNQKGFQCDVCFKTFKDKSKLRNHREIHTEERNVICPVCSKAFKTMNCLRNHKRLHASERTYFNCDQCEKRYTQKVQLKKHIEIVHMMRRDFICNTCGASFGTNSVLKMHILSHQDYRAEKCEICGFRFHTKAKLRRHMKSHTGERNYECSICYKKFLYSYNVVAHIRNVHEKNRRTRPYDCKYCTEKFSFQQKLSDHLAEVHQIHHIISDRDIIEEECLFEYESERQD